VDGYSHKKANHNFWPARNIRHFGAYIIYDKLFERKPFSRQKFRLFLSVDRKRFDYYQDYKKLFEKPG